VRKILPVKVPNAVVENLSMHSEVRSYSPGCNVLFVLALVLSAAASLRVNLNCWVYGPVVENWLLLLVVIVKGLLGRKVGLAAPIGPIIFKSAAAAVLGQAAEVCADIVLMSVPAPGLMVREPRLGGGVAPLAVPLTSNAAPAVTATTKVPDTNRVTNFLLCTI
jgi:hypothetical protein